MLYFKNHPIRYVILHKNKKKPVSDENYLYFQAQEDGVEVGLTGVGHNSSTINLLVSMDGETWTNWNNIISGSNRVFDTIQLQNTGDYFFIKNNNSSITNSSSKYLQFSTHNNVSAGGNVLSILTNNLSGNTLPGTYSCYRMFKDCTTLISGPEMPATILTNYCYANMFAGCTSLVTAPELPATTAKTGCYQNMFQNCSSLLAAPELPATTLAQYCYQHMFDGCLNLESAPELLPATTLVSYCYQYMFYNCSRLITAPELPATTLVSYCYQYMFNNCSSLNYIKVGATSWNTSYATSWVTGVRGIGLFLKKSSASISTGNNGIPTGWITHVY